MLEVLPILFLSIAGTSTPAPSGQAPIVKCENLNVPLSGLPDETIITFTIQPENLENQCRSETGTKITLTQPASGITITSSRKGQEAIRFTVEDKQGNQGSADVIVQRD